MSGADSIALVVLEASAVLAAIMVAVMVWLIVKRRRLEITAKQRQASEMDLARTLLQKLAGAVIADPGRFAEAPAEARLGAVSQLLRLIRGGDRERLLQIAESDGLFNATLAMLHSVALARRVDAMHVLEQFASPACIDALQARMAGDASPAARLEAACALARLGHLPPPAAVVDMLDLMHCTQTRLHRALFRSLAAQHADQLTAMVRSDDFARLRAMLVEALGWSEDYSVLATLENSAADSDPEVRSSALRAARKLGHPRMEPWVVPLLDDASDSVRIQAVQTCGQLGLRSAMPRLERLAIDPSWWVRLRASQALAILQSGGAAIALASRSA
jgi:HEAT repeat protein